MRQGLRLMDARLHGFARPDAVLTGVGETRALAGADAPSGNLRIPEYPGPVSLRGGPATRAALYPPRWTVFGAPRRFSVRKCEFPSAEGHRNKKSC